MWPTRQGRVLYIAQHWVCYTLNSIGFIEQCQAQNDICCTLPLQSPTVESSRHLQKKKNRNDLTYTFPAKIVGYGYAATIQRSQQADDKCGINWKTSDNKQNIFCNSCKIIKSQKNCGFVSVQTIITPTTHSKEMSWRTFLSKTNFACFVFHSFVFRETSQIDLGFSFGYPSWCKVALDKNVC